MQFNARPLSLSFIHTHTLARAHTHTQTHADKTFRIRIIKRYSQLFVFWCVRHNGARCNVFPFCKFASLSLSLLLRSFLVAVAVFVICLSTTFYSCTQITRSFSLKTLIVRLANSQKLWIVINIRSRTHSACSTVHSVYERKKDKINTKEYCFFGQRAGLHFSFFPCFVFFFCCFVSIFSKVIIHSIYIFCCSLIVFFPLQIFCASSMQEMNGLH